MQEINWLEVDSLYPRGGGHGVEFYAVGIPDGRALAFLHDCRWLHEPGHDVPVSIVRPSDDCPVGLLQRLKERIAAGLQAGKFDGEVLGEEFRSIFNA